MKNVAKRQKVQRKSMSPMVVVVGKKVKIVSGEGRGKSFEEGGEGDEE